MEIALVQILIAGILGLFPQIPDGAKSFVQSVALQLPDLVAAGVDADAFIRGELDRVKQMIAENRDPTQEEWDALNATVQSELDRLHAQGGGAAGSGA